MPKNPTSISSPGPTIRAFDPWAPSAGHMPHLLTDDERARLAVMASMVQFEKGEAIYRENEPADAVFNIISGVVSAYNETPDGSQHMVSFLLPDDLFGLAIEGRYANSAKAITAVSAYRLPYRITQASDQGCRAGISCHLQAVPGVAADPAARFFAESEKRRHQDCDVCANDRANPKC